MTSQKSVASVDWLTTNIYFESTERWYQDLVGSHLAHIAQDAKEKKEEIPTKVGDTDILVRGKSDEYIRADLCGARCRFHLPPYDPKDSWPAVKIEWSGEPFYTQTASQVVTPLLSFLLEHGAAISKATVSRLDVAVDLGGTDVEVFRQAEEEKRFVTRAKQTAIYKNLGDVKTLYLGKDPIMLRIYDKWAQLRHENNPPKMASYEHRMCGAFPASRIEFQVRGEKLKDFDFGAHTLDGALCGWGLVGKHCATEFCRMVTHRTTKTAELPLTEEWERVLGALDGQGDFAAGDAYEPQEPDLGN